MLRFCANLTTMYGRLPLPEALAAARADGFDAVECRSPFELPPEVVRDHLDELGLIMTQFNCPMGDFAAGDRGLTCVPGREEEFRASVGRTIAYARVLGVGQVNCVGGLIAPGATLREVEDVMVTNLRYAVPRMADAGIRLQIEPINPVDTPGVFLSSLDRFARVHERVAEPNLWLQYDFYHMQVIGADLLGAFERFASLVNHVQVADSPGRHEPGTGGIDHEAIFEGLERLGYGGWVGCEYVPATTAAAGLGWLRRYQAARAGRRAAAS